VLLQATDSAVARKKKCCCAALPARKDDGSTAEAPLLRGFVDENPPTTSGWMLREALRCEVFSAAGTRREAEIGCFKRFVTHRDNPIC
jgi:hypothetical protein